VRSTLLGASVALAASLLLAACSNSGGGQAIPGSGAQAAPMSYHTGVPVLAFKGISPATSCPSEYTACYEITPGTAFSDTWCISIVSPPSCNAPSDIYDGKVAWKDTTDVIDIATGNPTKDIKSKWKPAVSDQSTDASNNVTSKSSTPSTGGAVGYYFDFSATLKTGSYKGDVLDGAVGIIVE